jgi:hypothetical protein
MSVLDRAWVRITFAAVIALGLVAVACVDVAVAQQRRAHDRKVAAARAERRAEREFLAQLTPVADDVYRAAAPVQVVLSALADPLADDIFAARDALAHGNSRAALHKLSAQLHALHAPPGLRKQTASLVSAVDAMRDALDGLGSHANAEDFDKLAAALNGDDATGFGVAQGNFIDAVVAAYGQRRVTPPFSSDGNGPRSRPSSTSWIFAADRDCSTAAISLIPVRKYLKDNTLSGLKSSAMLWQRALSRLGTNLTRLPRPAAGAGALPVAITSRFRVLAANAEVFQAELRAITRFDEAGFAAADRRLHEVLPSLAQLGKSLRSYGAVECGRMMGFWAGDKSAGKPGGGVTAT